MRARWWWLLLLLWFSGAWAEVAVPALTQRVTDLTGTLDSAQNAALAQKLADFEKQKGAQIAILLVPTTQPETIEQYSIRVVEKWKLGRKGVDDGVLLLVAKNDHKLRIEVGRGLEGALTDVASKRIIADVISPHFKQGDVVGGLHAGVDGIMAVIQGAPLTTSTPTSPHLGIRMDATAWLAISAIAVGVLFLLWLLFFYRGRGRTGNGDRADFDDFHARHSFGSSQGSSDSFSGGGGDFSGGGSSGDW